MAVADFEKSASEPAFTKAGTTNMNQTVSDDNYADGEKRYILVVPLHTPCAFCRDQATDTLSVSIDGSRPRGSVKLCKACLKAIRS